MNFPLFTVFDVESVGLHGEDYAVGWVVVDCDGTEKSSGVYACDPAKVGGTSAGRKWVTDNAPKLSVTHTSNADMRSAFWSEWRRWANQGAVLAADVPWPVEARFLLKAVNDVRRITRGGNNWSESPREWEGPYPLIDVASVRLTAGFNPLEAPARLPNELPIHDPLADARQSARLLLEALHSCS